MPSKIIDFPGGFIHFGDVEWSCDPVRVTFTPKFHIDFTNDIKNESRGTKLVGQA